MRKLKVFPILLLLIIIFSSARPAAYALEDPTLKSTDAMILMDLNTGNVLYGINTDMHHSIASLTKVMTVLLAVEAVEKGEVSLDEEVTAGEDCRNGLEADSSTSGIQPGEIMTFKDLLYCAMVESANEACNVIGTRVAGSISAFVELMNARASELGCKDTHFMDPNGLTNRDGDHYSTTYDLSIIVREAISHPLFMEICNTTSYDVPATNLREGFTITNSNALISEGSIYGSGYIYEGAAGVKTGFTKAAGYCLISTCEKNGIRLLAIVLGCNGQLTYTYADDYENFVDSRTLYDWAYANFSYRNILTEGEAVQQIQVEKAKNNEQAVLRPSESLKLLLPNDIDENSIDIRVNITDLNPTAPISAGTVLGYAEIYIDGEDYGKVNLITAESIELNRTMYFKEALNKIFSAGWVKIVIFIIVLAAAGYFILLYRYKKIQRERREQRIRAEQKRRRQEMQRKEAEDASPKKARKTVVYSEKDPTQYYAKIAPDKRDPEQQDIDEIIKSLNLDE